MNLPGRNKRSSKDIALVLSGGAARGIAHIGVIEVLLERGYQITSVAGTSMGSVVGGVYASGKLDEFKEWICELDMVKAMMLIDFTVSRQGMIKGDKIFRKVQDFIPDVRIEEMEIPFAAVAAELTTREEVVFRSGSLYDAIRASVSIPTILTPVKTDEGLLIDGGVLNNLPVNVVERTKKDKLFAVDVNANIDLELPPDMQEVDRDELTKYQKRKKDFANYLQKLNPLNREDKMHYFDLITDTIELMTGTIEGFRLKDEKVDLLIQISRHSSNLYDFFKAEELIAIGRHVTARTLDEYENR